MDGGETMSIGVGIFLMVLGAIMAFAVETDVPGINVNTLGVILLVIGFVISLYFLVVLRPLPPSVRAGGPPPPAAGATAAHPRPQRVADVQHRLDGGLLLEPPTELRGVDVLDVLVDPPQVSLGVAEGAGHGEIGTAS